MGYRIRFQMPILILFLALILLPCRTAYAGDVPRVTDEAGLLTREEQAELERRLDNLYEEHLFDGVLVIKETLGGKDAQAYADDFFDGNHFGGGEDRDGCLFLISMEERDWVLSTSGYSLNKKGIRTVQEDVLGYLSQEEYYRAFDAYVSDLERFLRIDQTAYENETGKHLPSPLWLLADILAGGLLAAGPMRAGKAQLKSVVKKTGAAEYLAGGKKSVIPDPAASGDYFIRTEYLTRPIPVNTDRSGGGRRSGSSRGGSTYMGRMGSGGSTHRSSSGRFHGGSRGKF